MVTDEDKKSDSGVSIGDKENLKENLIIDNKLEKVKEKLSGLSDNLSDSSSTDNDFEEMLNEKNKDIKLTITNENGETTTVIGDQSRIQGFQRNAHLIKV